MKKFNQEELHSFDGREGRQPYISYKEHVYDVTKSPLWKTGTHMNIHQAGKDLTEFLSLAPHSEEVFQRYPMIGELEAVKKADQGPKTKLEEFISRRHPHPITVHFPIALMLSQALFALIFLITAKGPFETAGYYVMTLGLLATPVTILTGLVSWGFGYAGAFTSIFRGKMIFSGVLFALSITCFIWRTLNPQVLIQLQGSGWLYLVLILALAPVVLILGYLGSKITFG